MVKQDSEHLTDRQIRLLADSIIRMLAHQKFMAGIREERRYRRRIRKAAA